MWRAWCFGIVKIIRFWLLREAKWSEQQTCCNSLSFASNNIKIESEVSHSPRRRHHAFCFRKINVYLFHRKWTTPPSKWCTKEQPALRLARHMSRTADLTYLSFRSLQALLRYSIYVLGVSVVPWTSLEATSSLSESKYISVTGCDNVTQGVRQQLVLLPLVCRRAICGKWNGETLGMAFV